MFVVEFERIFFYEEMRENLCSACCGKSLQSKDIACCANTMWALATCPQETLPRETVMFTRVKADLLTCTWLCSEHIAFGELLLVIIFYGIRPNYKHYLTELIKYY